MLLDKITAEELSCYWTRSQRRNSCVIGQDHSGGTLVLLDKITALNRSPKKAVYSKLLLLDFSQRYSMTSVHSPLLSGWLGCLGWLVELIPTNSSKWKQLV